MGLNGLIFAILTTFDSGLLNKSKMLVHFLVNLIYGGSWEILSCSSHSLCDFWRFQMRFRIEKAKKDPRVVNFGILVSVDQVVFLKSA